MRPLGYSGAGFRELMVSRLQGFMVVSWPVKHRAVWCVSREALNWP